MTDAPETQTVVITLAHVAEEYAQSEFEATHGQLTALLTWFRIGKERTHTFIAYAQNGRLLSTDLTREHVAAIVTVAP